MVLFETFYCQPLILRDNLKKKFPKFCQRFRLCMFHCLNLNVFLSHALRLCCIMVFLLKIVTHEVRFNLDLCCFFFFTNVRFLLSPLFYSGLKHLYATLAVNSFRNYSCDFRIYNGAYNNSFLLTVN